MGGWCWPGTSPRWPCAWASTSPGAWRGSASSVPWPGCPSSSADGRDEHELVAVAERGVEGRVAAVDGGGEARTPVGQERMVSREQGPRVFRGRTRGQVQLHLTLADRLPQRREQPHPNAHGPT